MKKENKTRTVCMNCLHSVVTTKHDSDPARARLVVTWGCNKCDEEDDDISFFDYQMRELINQVPTYNNIGNIHANPELLTHQVSKEGGENEHP